MPDDVIQDLIAHELAHGLQDADGIRCTRVYSDGRAVYVSKDGSYFGCRIEIEEDADYTILGWGFDPDSIDRWALEVGISKVIEVDDLATMLPILMRRAQRRGR